MTETILEKIYRFPIKGFLGQELTSTHLKAGRGIANDRRYAITKGVEDTGEWVPSRNYFINARVDGMSKFKCDFDGETLHLKNILGEELNFKLDNQASLDAANAKIISFMQPVITEEVSPPPQIIDRGEGSVWDYIDTPISIINAESVKSLDEKLNTQLDPLRFRGNLIVSGLPAWEEFSWMGKRIQIGDTILDVHRPIDRCPTPGVNPKTGERDIEVTAAIRDHFGHIYCGMYANVVQGGEINADDTINVIGDAEIKLETTLVSNASNYALWPRMVEVTAYDVQNDKTKITLKTLCPWQLPPAQAGQRIKLHLGTHGWTEETLTSVSTHQYEIEIADGKTDNSLPQLLLNKLKLGKQVVITGPYGRV